ncbi:unnamed protein product [Caenorhabditis nigoni]
MAPPKQPLPFEDAGASTDATMANKPDEPAFKLSLNANKVEFPFSPIGRPTYVSLRLHNPTSNRITFKVRCTSADIFRVQPPVAFVNPNGLMTITIWNANTDQKQKMEKRHYFAFYHKTAVPSARLAPPLWKNGLKDAEGVRRIPVSFLPDPSGTKSSTTPQPAAPSTPAASAPAPGPTAP